MGKRFKRLSHTIYECKYHVVFCPKYRFRILDGDIALYADQKLNLLASYKEKVELLELNVPKDYIHMVMSIPPKYSVSSLMGYLKRKMALRLFQRYEKLGKRYWGRRLWSRGYCVSTVGLNEDQIRKYVRWQEQKEKEAEQHQPDLFE